MAHKAIFTDCFKIVQPSEEEKAIWSDSFGDFTKPTGRGLFTYMEATHSAIGNRNKRFYLPSMMRDGADTFLQGKPAPILKHHGGGPLGGDQDPVGKVKTVEYITTIPEDLMADKNVAILTDSDVPLRKQVRAAKSFMKNDFVLQREWKGLGYIRLGAMILDPKAIQQVKDELFDSVSVSFGSNHAFCSYCGADWLGDDDGPCEHEPGEIYEDEETGEKEQALLIPGKMVFRECSLVTFDADPHTAIAISAPGMMDAEKETETRVFRDESVYELQSMSWEVHDSEKGADMKKINVNDDQVIELSDAEEAIFNILKDYEDLKEKEETKLAEWAKTIEASRGEDGKLPDQDEAELDDQTAVFYAAEDLMYDGEVDAEAVYADMEVELAKMAEEGLLTEDELKDAKLSTTQRKKLKGSTFCGPDRSFPVPDCAHVTAARRLIGRYKGPGNKSSILSCVSRKAKALGCSSSKDAEVDPSKASDECAENLLKDLDDAALLATFHSVNLEMVDRKLAPPRECDKCGEATQRAEDAEQQAAESKEKYEGLASTVEILRDELRNEFSNYKVLVDEYVALREELQEVRLNYASAVSVLGGKHTKLTEATEHLKAAEDFDKEYTSLTDSVDLDEIFGKMNDGMANDEPEGTVEDPTINNDADNEQGPAGLSKTEEAIIERIKEHMEDGDVGMARALYDRMKRKEILGDSVTWETIFSAAADEDEADE